MYQMTTPPNWKPVVGYENSYSVSDKGEIKSKLSGKVLRPNNSKNGLRVALYDNGIPKIFPVRSLVLAAFVGPCPANHWPVNVDGNDENNALSNLKYQSRSDYLRTNMIGTVKLSNSEKEEIIDRIKSGESKTSIAALMGVSVSRISTLWSEYEHEQST